MIGPFALACLDMAGTTVHDDGAVDAAFRAALAAVGVAEGTEHYRAAESFVRETMGWSKADVFGALLEPADAVRATDTFAAAYEAQARGRRRPRDTRRPRRLPAPAGAGRRGLPHHRVRAVDPGCAARRPGWRGEIDLALSPADVGRGRPAPDMILGAMDHLGVAEPDAVVVVGDTTSDLEAGTRAGAGAVIGVLSGAHDEATLAAVPHTALLSDVSELVGLLERS